MQSIINSIIQNPEYKQGCKKICNGRDIHNDLYQEFILVLLQKPKEEIEKAHTGDYLKFYCFNLIINIYHNRTEHLRYSKNGNGKSHPLFEINSISNPDVLIEDYEPSVYNSEIDYRYNKVQEVLQTHFTKPNERFYATLFQLAQTKKKTEIHKETGIPYSTIGYSCDFVKKKIKQILNPSLCV